MPGKGFLSGYKTYIAAAVGIASAVAAFAAGVEIQGVPALDLADTMQVVFEGILAVTIRKGIKAGANK